MTVPAKVLVLVTWLAAACSTDGGGPSREDCERLREHVADLAVGQGAATLSAEEREKHRASLGATGGEEYIDACVKERSEKYIECALAAETLEALGRCGGKR